MKLLISESLIFKTLNELNMLSSDEEKINFACLLFDYLSKENINKNFLLKINKIYSKKFDGNIFKKEYLNTLNG